MVGVQNASLQLQLAQHEYSTATGMSPTYYPQELVFVERLKQSAQLGTEATDAGEVEHSLRADPATLV